MLFWGGGGRGGLPRIWTKIRKAKYGNFSPCLWVDTGGHYCSCFQNLFTLLWFVSNCSPVSFPIPDCINIVMMSHLTLNSKGEANYLCAYWLMMEMLMRPFAACMNWNWPIRRWDSSSPTLPLDWNYQRDINIPAARNKGPWLPQLQWFAMQWCSSYMGWGFVQSMFLSYHTITYNASPSASIATIAGMGDFGMRKIKIKNIVGGPFFWPTWPYAMKQDFRPLYRIWFHSLEVSSGERLEFE